jgi:hypothetical protein
MIEIRKSGSRNLINTVSKEKDDFTRHPSSFTNRTSAHRISAALTNSRVTLLKSPTAEARAE